MDIYYQLKISSSFALNILYQKTKRKSFKFKVKIHPKKLINNFKMEQYHSDVVQI